MGRPGFAPAVGAWIASLLAIFWPGHHLPSDVETAIVIGAVVLTHAHVTGRWMHILRRTGKSDLGQALEAIAQKGGPDAAP